MDNVDIKEQVRDFWNQQACGTQFSDSEKYTRDYFDDIEEHRYTVEPEIHRFAQFTRHHGQKLLEVGVGAGTDFLQWVRAGTVAYGIDATPEGVEHVRQRLAVYDLAAEEIRVADCEALPYDSDSFDVVYSWGVIHHTPDTPRAMREIVRVCKPGGKCKVMIYHRRSLLTFFVWFRRALLAGKPWRSFKYCLYHYMESIGTKAYTRHEAEEMLRGEPIENLKIVPVLTYYDRMTRFNAIFRSVASFLAWAFGGDRVGWFLTIEFDKKK
jgi:ubiquinone/menaquinone biosynthesis C-methylase UbiE